VEGVGGIWSSGEEHCYHILPTHSPATAQTRGELGDPPGKAWGEGPAHFFSTGFRVFPFVGFFCCCFLLVCFIFGFPAIP